MCRQKEKVISMLICQKLKDFGRKQEYRKQVTLYMFKGALTESKSHMEFKSKDAVNV